MYDTEEQSQQPNQDYSRTAAHWFLKIDSAYLRPFLIRNNINTGSQYLFLEDQMGEFEHELDVTRQETVLLQQ